MNNIYHLIDYIKAYNVQNSDVLDELDPHSFNRNNSDTLVTSTKKGKVFVKESEYVIPEKLSDIDRDYRIACNIIKFKNEELPKEALSTWC